MIQEETVNIGLCHTVSVLQGASEEATPKKDKLEKSNENYQKVKEVRSASSLFLTSFDVVSAVFTCQSFSVGGTAVVLCVGQVVAGGSCVIYLFFCCVKTVSKRMLLQPIRMSLPGFLHPIFKYS